MSIMELGALGEFVGAIAVIVTLVYLAVQLRQNTQMQASVIRQNFYDGTQRQMLHAVESSEFNTLLFRGWSTGDELSPSESMQIWRHLQGVLMGYQGAYEQYRSGVLPPKDWELARTILRSFWLFDGVAKTRAWRQMKDGGFFHEDFLAEVQRLEEEARSYRERLVEEELTL